MAETIRECRPAPCEDDDDCGDFVCLTIEVASCEGGGATPACPPDTECEAPAEPPAEPRCTTEEQKLCGPPWADACETAADCGDAERFTCAPVEICQCSSGGSGGSGGSGDAPSSEDGGASEPAPADAGPECSCVPTGDNYCKPNEIDCTADSECPEDWTCVASAEDSGACSFDPDTNEEMCPTPTTTKHCAPPGWDLVTGSAAFDDALGAGAGAGEETRNPESPTPTPTPMPTADAGTGAGGAPGTGSDDGSCAVAPLRAGHAASMVFAIGLPLMLLVVARRRRR
jgi:hypothetical protein